MTRNRVAAAASAILLACLLTGCTPGGTGSPQKSTDVASSSAAPPAGPGFPPVLPGRPREIEEFSTPSGNLACRLDDDEAGGFVGCQVEVHNYPGPPTPADCEGDLVPVVWIDQDDVVTFGMCRGDPFALPQTTLDYGSAAAHGDYVCLSEQQGVSCWNRDSKHGFTVARESYSVF